MNIREAAIELRWFFGEAEGELGLRGVSLEPSGGGEQPEAAASRQTSAYLRWTDTSRRLTAIGAPLERVLRLAYTPHRWAGLGRWYELAGVAAWLTDREDVIAAARRIEKLATTEADALRARAKDMLRTALREFVEAK